MEFIDCKFTITSDKKTRTKKVKYEVEKRESGGDEAELENPDQYIEGELCDDELTKLTVERINRFVGGNTEFCQRADLRLLGSHLYHILFGGKTTNVELSDGKPPSKSPSALTLGERFVRRFTKFREEYDKRKNRLRGVDPEYRLRVILIFEEEDEMKELAAYPWEFLYVPRPNNEGFFVAGMETGLILTRCVPPVKKLPPPDERLTIVVAWAQPKELKPVEVTETITIIQELAQCIQTQLTGKDKAEMNENGRNGNIDVIPVPNATYKGLQDLITEKKPRIVHFIGHGKNEDGKGLIAFMKPPEKLAEDRADLIRRGLSDNKVKEAHWVTSDDMQGLFQGEPPLLVFLQACYSAQAPESLKIFESVARKVLLTDVHSVVAMQYEISNADAIEFAQAFYKNLGEEKSIEEAVKAGRNMLGKRQPSWGHPRFGTPVVYLRSEDGAVVMKKTEDSSRAVQESAPPPTGPSTQKCPYPQCPVTVAPDQKSCDCERKIRFKQCPNCTRANLADASECKFQGCSHTWLEQPSQLPASAQVSSFTQSERGAGQAEPPATPHARR